MRPYLCDNCGSLKNREVVEPRMSCCAELREGEKPEDLGQQRGMTLLSWAAAENVHCGCSFLTNEDLTRWLAFDTSQIMPSLIIEPGSSPRFHFTYSIYY